VLCIPRLASVRPVPIVSVAELSWGVVMKIIVVGAGISGLATAWSLIKRGHDVVLLEQGTIPNPLAASGDHHRIIRRAYGPDTGYGAAITEAYAAWDEMWADLGVSHYDARGFMAVSRQEGDEAERYLEGLKQGGWPHELLLPEAAARRWPFLKIDGMRYAYSSPEGGALHCRRIAIGICEWLRAHGADVRENTRVAMVDPQAGSVELEDGETLVGDRIVVCAGAWVLKLFPQLSAQLTTYRTAVVYLDPPTDLDEAWSDAPVILDVGGDTDGYIIPPSGDGGLKFGSGLHKQRSDDASADRAPFSGEGKDILQLFAASISPVEDYEVSKVTSCVYTFTEDERFFATEVERCIVVSACSGHGYKFGAAVGRRVAEAVESGNVVLLQQWLRAETE
jgi:sarcosine oxidase